MKPIVVTGATGKTGSVVARELLSQKAHVRAVVHRRDQRSDALQELGAEIVVADLHDYNELVPALRGASAAYYIPPWDELALDSAAAFACAAKDARLPAIVELSQWLSSPAHPSLLTRQHWLITRMFSTLHGVARVTINPGFFADNLLILDMLRNAVHLGIYPYPMSPDMRNAPPSNEDIGRVAAAVLLDPLAHAGQSYRPTGPKLITGDDVVSTLSKLLGRKIRRFAPPRAILVRALAAAGYSSSQRADAIEYFQESSAWAVDAPNDTVRALTGREPEDFETIARRYVTHPALQKTLGNRVNALVDFVRIGFTNPQTPEAYRRSLKLFTPAHATRSSDSSQWLQAHLPANSPSLLEAVTS